MFKKTLLYASVSLLTLSANAMFDERYEEISTPNLKISIVGKKEEIKKDSFSSDEKSFGSASTKLSFSAGPYYKPKNEEELTQEDVIALIHEQNFLYDNPEKTTYLKLLGTPEDPTNLYCYEELQAHYSKIGQTKLVEEINKKLSE